MGLYLHLHVNINKIKAEDWESAWTESLDLLQRFPLPLCRLGAETINGRRRLVYARDLRINQGQSDEAWKVEGDLLSGKRGETFLLYRHLPWYKNRYARTEGILELWESKTQGFPYHLALLAVGIMLENRFPEHCDVFGDIDQSQSSAVIEWLEAVYGKPFLPPLCLDAQRLFRAMKAKHENHQDAIEAFGNFWRGSGAEACSAFLEHAGREATFGHYARKLNKFKSLDQWGPRDMLRDVLEATGSLSELIALVEQAIAQRPADKEPFDWMDVLKMLCDDCIFIKPVEREAIKQLTGPGEDMQDSDQVFGQLFLKMAGIPHISPLYVPEDELLECFALRDPARGKEYHALIENKKAELDELLSEVGKTVRGVDEMLSQNEALRQPDEEENISDSTAPHERYILLQAWRQKDRYAHAEKVMAQMRKALLEMIREDAYFQEDRDIKAYLDGIYACTDQAGIALSEAAWKAIDALTDKTVLKYLHALAAVDNRELTFWRWRIRIFETPELWEAFREDGMS